jgi:1,4-dihydroxy-2-naphthoyl-CoA synthase
MTVTEIKMAYDFQTIKARMNSGVLFATFDNPPVNLIGPALVPDLVDLLNTLEHDEDVRVVVFASADESSSCRTSILYKSPSTPKKRRGLAAP